MNIENKRLRRTLLAVAILVVSGIIYAVESSGRKSTTPAAPVDLPQDERQYTAAPDFDGATGWLNTAGNASVPIASLRGQVVLVDFWTYSCINCIHTLPHITKLYDTYRDHGLVVVGVHSPEFGFEKVRGNVQDAIERYAIHYPVPQDNDFGIWNAYHNQFWPAHYLIDQYGRIRDTHFGEGSYEETEAKVRQLLVAANHTDLPPPVEAGIKDDFGSHSPELYAAEGGRSAIANPEGYQPDRDVTYAHLDPPPRDQITLEGIWHDGEQSITARGNATVRVDFHGIGANVVAAGPAGSCVQVLLDGMPPDDQHVGPDVRRQSDGSACLVLQGSRSYDVYAGPRERHVLTLQVPTGFELFTFDFT